MKLVKERVKVCKALIYKIDHSPLDFNGLLPLIYVNELTHVTDL
jgi:hypothetical protein